MQYEWIKLLALKKKLMEAVSFFYFDFFVCLGFRLLLLSYCRLCLASKYSKMESHW